jgi:hypothetical protein
MSMKRRKVAALREKDVLSASFQTLVIATQNVIVNKYIPTYPRCTRNIYALRSFSYMAALVTLNKCIEQQKFTTHVAYYWIAPRNFRITVFLPLSVIDMALHQDGDTSINPTQISRLRKRGTSSAGSSGRPHSTPDFPIGHPLSSITTIIIATEDINSSIIRYNQDGVERDIEVTLGHMMTNVQRPDDMVTYFRDSIEAGHVSFIPGMCGQRVNMYRLGVTPHYIETTPSLARKHLKLCVDSGSSRMPHMMPGNLDIVYMRSADLMRQVGFRQKCTMHFLCKAPVHTLITFQLTNATVGNLLKYNKLGNISVKIQRNNSAVDFKIATPDHVRRVFPHIRPFIYLKLYKCRKLLDGVPRIKPLIIVHIPYAAREPIIRYILDILRPCIDFG